MENKAKVVAPVTDESYTDLKVRASTVLRTVFHYDKFRDNQFDIVATLLGGSDALVIMPTGGGKSMCYQLPALLYDKGLTLVVSPLISLMEDQVGGLKVRDISAEYLNSTLSRYQIDDIYRRLETDEIRLLYVAPERFAVESFYGLLKRIYARDRLNLIAVDEAHCISEWGCDFRADYRRLSIFKRDFTRTPVVALTASATESVRRDIIDQLKIDGCRVFISSFDRPNLFYRAYEFNETLFQQELARYRGQSAIIYCQTRGSVDRLTDKLNADKYSAKAYHAGLDSDTRTQVQRDFLEGRVQIIVATVAFGMGIDKPDVRLVVHYNLPKSIEGYYQETGRAGRDGGESECILFYRTADVYKRQC